MERLRRARQSVRAFWIDHLWTDLLIVVALVGGHFVIVWLYIPEADLLGHSSPVDRRAVYSATAIVVSLLGSFSAVAISQLSAAKGARADALRSQAAEVLAKNWRSIFLAGMMSALIALFCLVVDPSRPTALQAEDWLPVAARWLFEAGLIYAVVKFFRLTALFFEVITLASKSSGEPEAETIAPAPTFNPEWSVKHR